MWEWGNKKKSGGNGPWYVYNSGEEIKYNFSYSVKRKDNRRNCGSGALGFYVLLSYTLLISHF